MRLRRHVLLVEGEGGHYEAVQQDWEQYVSDLVTLILRDYARINNVNENEEEADENQQTATRQWLVGVVGVGGGRDSGTGEGSERDVPVSFGQPGKAMRDVLCILVSKSKRICSVVKTFCVCVMFVI